LFSKSLEWKYKHNDPRHIIVEFSIDEYNYLVELRSGDGDFDVALGNPEEHLVGVWEVSFTQYSSREGPKDHITGSGNALPILTTVMEILAHVIKDRNIQTISFTADNTEPSRVKLYHRLAKQFEKKGWRYIDHKEQNARSGLEDEDDAAAGRGYSFFILTKQPQPSSSDK